MGQAGGVTLGPRRHGHGHVRRQRLRLISQGGQYLVEGAVSTVLGGRQQQKVKGGREEAGKLTSPT